MRRWRATVATPGELQCKTARSGELAQHFSNASCSHKCFLHNLHAQTLTGITVTDTAILIFHLWNKSPVQRQSRLPSSGQ